MNKKNLTPYLLIGLCLLLFVLAELFIPKPLNWTVTLSAEDKNPYGAYGLYKVLPDLFQEEVKSTNLTLYETDSLPVKNYLILSENFIPGEEDTEVLLNKVSGGAQAFIAASNFRGEFADTLHLSVDNLLFRSISEGGEINSQNDSVYIHFAHQPAETFAYTMPAASTFFDSIPPNSKVLARNHLNQPVFIRTNFGEGNFYLSSIPLAYSNYYLLANRNHVFIEGSLSYLPEGPLFWTEYYQLGRMEARTPLRFVLSHTALSLAYYMGITILLLFILFGLKRRQRPIPTIVPPQNTSLQFAGSIGMLYFQQGDHLNLARKKVLYLKEYIRSHFRLTYEPHDPDFVTKLSQKSNKPEEEVNELLMQVHKAERAQQYSAEDLMKLHKAIQSFYQNYE